MAVYLGYAFTPEFDSKQEANNKLYQQLKQKYEICVNEAKFLDTDKFSDYDLVIVRIPKQGHSEFQILKDETSLTPEEILLTCAEGRLYFGGRKVNPTCYEVFED